MRFVNLAQGVSHRRTVWTPGAGAFFDKNSMGVVGVDRVAPLAIDFGGRRGIDIVSGKRMAGICICGVPGAIENGRYHNQIIGREIAKSGGIAVPANRIGTRFVVRQRKRDIEGEIKEAVMIRLIIIRLPAGQRLRDVNAQTSLIIGMPHSFRQKLHQWRRRLKCQTRSSQTVVFFRHHGRG